MEYYDYVNIVGDSDFKDSIVQLISAANRYNPLVEKINAFFNDLNLVEIGQVVMPYKFYGYMLIFDDFLKEQGYTIVEKYNSSMFRNNPDCIRIQWGYNAYRTIPEEGSFFLHNSLSNIKLHITFYRLTNDNFKIKIQASQCNSDVINEFLNSLDKQSLVNHYLKGKKISAEGEFLDIEDLRWDDIILDSEVRQAIVNNIENLFKHAKLFDKYGITAKRGLILSGEPGTGKTMLGKVLATELNTTFIWVTPGKLSDRNIDMIYQMARELSPSIIFLEDLDLYGGQRNENMDNRTLGELMNQLDGIVSNENIAVIATTNKVDVVEEALKNRPGRFDEILHIKKPSEKARKRMLEVFTNKFDKTFDSDRIAQETKGLTGSHIKNLVTLAFFNALENTEDEDNIELTNENFLSVLPKAKNLKIEPREIGFRKKSNDLECFDARSYLDDD